MNKSEFRKRHIQLRDGLSKNEIEEKSVAIHKRLFETDFYIEAKAIMVYVSYKSEVRTDGIIKQALSDGKRVIVPVCSVCDTTITPCLINSHSELEAGSYGISEPVNQCVINTDELDLVILPGVVFDKAGNRIGYGKGYYDRFLGGMRNAGKTIGLAFAINVEDAIPKEAHDKPVDMVITEDGVF